MKRLLEPSNTVAVEALSPMYAYRSPARLRSLIAFALMLAVLFASSLSGTAVASAATIDHDMQMMELGHCSSPPAKQADKAPVRPCCIAMYMAVAVTPSVPAEFVELDHSASYFFVPASRHGYLGEIATPPPRNS